MQAMGRVVATSVESKSDLLLSDNQGATCGCDSQGSEIRRADGRRRWRGDNRRPGDGNRRTPKAWGRCGEVSGTGRRVAAGQRPGGVCSPVAAAAFLGFKVF